MKRKVLLYLLVLLIQTGAQKALAQNSAATSQSAQSTGGLHPHYQVYALRFAAMGNKTPTSFWALRAPASDSVDIYFSIWLIKGDNGKNILVDAGFLHDMTQSPEAKGFGLIYDMRPDSTLAKLGLKPTDITDVILSHPHWDHVDGIGLYPNARIWVQKDDYAYFVGGAWQKGGNSGGFQKRDVQLLVNLNMAGKLILVDGDNKEIIPGITVFTGSRHTYNSQFVRVETGSKPLILASDNIWVYYSLDHLCPPSPGGTFDTTAYLNSMRRMKTLVTDIRYIIPGHDARVFAQFPKIAEGVVRIQ
jgi:glyoxylase-like metal-dependent hydrolase (beta-lactamase superfamily II)